jgi:hypothetical protein
MKFLILTQTNIKKNKIKSYFKQNLNITIIDMEKEKLTNFKLFNLIIILTKKILNRTNPNYKKVLSLANKNNIKIIEAAFEKSTISNEKAFSESIIHGFGSMTLELINKIIKDYKHKK